MALPSRHTPSAVAQSEPMECELAEGARRRLRTLVEPRASAFASHVLRVLLADPLLREGLSGADPDVLVRELGAYLVSLAAPRSPAEHRATRRRVEWRYDTLGLPAVARATAFDECVSLLRKLAAEACDGDPRSISNVLEGLERHAGPRVLVVDDDPDWREVFEIALEDAGARVYSAGDDALAVGLGQRLDLHVAVVDWILGSRRTGLDVIEALQAANPAIPCIFVTGYPSSLLPEDLRRARVYRHLEKPFDVATLRSAVAEAAFGTH